MSGTSDPKNATDPSEQLEARLSALEAALQRGDLTADEHAVARRLAIFRAGQPAEDAGTSKAAPRRAAEGSPPRSRPWALIAAAGLGSIALAALLVTVLMTNGDSQADLASSTAPPLEIRGTTGDTQGVVIAGWQTQKPLGAAIGAFGKPTSLRRESWECVATWKALRMTASFYNLGGQAPCSRAGGMLGTAIMRGKRWQTDRGLAVGDTLAQVRRAYPSARIAPWGPREGLGAPIGARVWLLQPGWSNLSGSFTSAVSALMVGGKVAAFQADIGAGGE